MANVKISQLEAKTSLSANDVFPIVDTDNSATKKVTAENLKSYVNNERKEYELYEANVSTTGTEISTYNEIVNEVGDLDISATGAGKVELSSKEAGFSKFKPGKVIISISMGFKADAIGKSYTIKHYIENGKITFVTMDDGAPVDGVWNNTTITIKVYP